MGSVWAPNPLNLQAGRHAGRLGGTPFLLIRCNFLLTFETPSTPIERVLPTLPQNCSWNWAASGWSLMGATSSSCSCSCCHPLTWQLLPSLGTSLIWRWLKQLAAYGRPPAVTTPTGPLIFATADAAAAHFYYCLLFWENKIRKTKIRRKTNE